MLHNARKTRIEWSDCDPAGIIFYPRYFEIFDTGTTALFERALSPAETARCIAVALVALRDWERWQPRLAADSPALVGRH